MQDVLVSLLSFAELKMQETFDCDRMKVKQVLIKNERKFELSVSRY